MKKEEYKTEISNIEYWFDKEYTKQEQKLRRLVALNKKCDDGADAQTQLNNLYNEAETKRLRIQELEKLLV